jgi:GUN4-like
MSGFCVGDDASLSGISLGTVRVKLRFGNEEADISDRFFQAFGTGAQRSKPVNVRYADLERYLKNEQWEEADDETYRLMNTEVGKNGEWFDPDDLRNFPCEPLRAIDGLWVKHSRGKFGFSVQKKLYLECGGVLDGKYYKEAWTKFCEANGWVVKGRWAPVEFDTSSPDGYLPLPRPDIWGSPKLFRILLSRIQTCEL